MYRTKRRYNGEPVRPDPTVDPTENETAIYFTSADRSAWVSSYEPVVVERLLHHPNFKVEQLITMQIEEEECVVGVIGRLPIGAVRLGRATTKDNHELVVQVPRHAKQVSTQKARKSQNKREPPLNLQSKPSKTKAQALAQRRRQSPQPSGKLKRKPKRPPRASRGRER